MKIICFLHPRYHPKTIGHILKNVQKSSVSICLFLWDYMINYNEVKKKNGSHRCDINRPTSRLGLTYTKYKRYLSMMMLVCIKQHPTDTWGSIYEKVKKRWSWVEKNVLLIKHKRVQQKTKTMKRRKSTETALNLKIPIAKRFSY